MGLNMEKIALNIKSKRVKADLTQKQAADKLGICLTTYRRHECDPSNITFSLLVDMANLYGCDIQSFFVD